MFWWEEWERHARRELGFPDAAAIPQLPPCLNIPQKGDKWIRGCRDSTSCNFENPGKASIQFLVFWGPLAKRPGFHRAKQKPKKKTRSWDRSRIVRRNRSPHPLYHPYPPFRRWAILKRPRVTTKAYRSGSLPMISARSSLRCFRISANGSSVRGCFRPGAISSSGSNTKARSCMRGCGISRSRSAATTSP